MAKTIQPFHAPDGTQGNSEPITRGPCAMSLSRPGRRSAQASGGEETARLRRKAQESLTQV